MQHNVCANIFAHFAVGLPEHVTNSSAKVNYALITVLMFITAPVDDWLKSNPDCRHSLGTMPDLIVPPSGPKANQFSMLKSNKVCIVP